MHLHRTTDVGPIDDFMDEFLYLLFDEDNSNVDEQDRGATD